jgi:glycine cleavage system aminomethyltransferase T
MSSVEQHLATRQAAGLFDFSFMGLYELDGTQALKRLQTRDLDRLARGQIAYTLILGEGGAVRIDATVWRIGEARFWLFAGKRDAYGGRDRSGEFAILALQGPASGTILAKLVGRDAVGALRYFHFTQVGPMIVGRIGFSGELGYELLVPAGEAPALRARLLDAGRGEGLRECGWAAADSLRIEAGYVLFDREVDGEANPRELGLDRLVDGPREFELRRKLAGLEILAGSADADLPAAVVTSECISPTLGKTLALGFVPAAVSQGDPVRASGRLARVVPLPFYDPERRRPRAAPLGA